jgi:hypothetical protein
MSEMSENFRGVGRPRAEFNFASARSGVPTPTAPQEKISREYCKCARKLTSPFVTVGAGKKSDESSVMFPSPWITMPHVHETSVRVRAMRIKFFSRRCLGGAKNPTFPTSVVFEVIGRRVGTCSPTFARVATSCRARRSTRTRRRSRHAANRAFSWFLPGEVFVRDLDGSSTHLEHSLFLCPSCPVLSGSN